MSWSRATDAGTGPGSCRDRHRLRAGGAAERGRAVAVPADRRLRLPLELPHGRAGRPRRRDRLAVRAGVRLAERLRQPARPRGRLLPASGRSGSTTRPTAALRAGDERARDDLEDAVGLGRRPRRVDDGPARPRGRRSPRTRGRRPTTTPTTCSFAPSSASRARSRSSSSASRSSTTAAQSAEWTLVDGSRHVADATGGGQTVRLVSDLALGHRGQPGPRAAHARSPATGRTARSRGRRGSPRRRTATRREARIGRRPSSTGVAGSAARGSPTIGCGIRSSARRSRSRA